MSDLADRIKAYLSDHPSNGGHSDAAGGNAWELLDEAMWEVTAAADRIEALEAALRYYADPNNYSGYGMYELARAALSQEQDK